MNCSTRAASYPRSLLLIGAAALATLAPVAAASADTQGLAISFALSSTGTATPGSTIHYFGTFTSLLADDNLYLSGIALGGDLLGDHADFTLSDSMYQPNMESSLTRDITPGNEDFFYLTPGQKAMFEVFSVAVNPGAIVGNSAGGTVDFEGGGPGVTDSLFQPGTVIPFRVQVAGATAVPEGGTLALALLGLAGTTGAGIVRRRAAR